MTLGGFCFMAGSWLVILGVFVYTMVRTLRGRGSGIIFQYFLQKGLARGPQQNGSVQLAQY